MTEATQTFPVDEAMGVPSPGSAFDTAKNAPLFPPRWFALTAGALGFLFFLAVTADQLYHGRLYQLNDPLRFWFHEHAPPLIVFLSAAFSGLGELFILVPIGLAGGIYLLRNTRGPSLLVLWAVSLLACPVMNNALKEFFKVPRPENLTFYAFPPHPGYSYPSGHTMGALIVLGTLLLFGLRMRLLKKSWQRVAGITLFACISLAVPFSLLAVGVHTLTEVLAGIGLSYGWLGMVAASLGHIRIMQTELVS